MLFKANETILLIGDSVTDAGRARPIGEGRVEGWGNGYPMMVGSSLGAMYPELKLRVLNMGTSGNTVRDLAARWQEDVLNLKPDWVSICIGINDVWRQFDCPLRHDLHVLPEEYERTYRSLLEKTLPHVKGMLLLSPYFMEPNLKDPMRVRMDEYTAIVKALAKEYGTLFVDMQAEFDSLFTHTHPMSIAWDRIHPNNVGHMLMAKAYLKAIGFDR